MIGIKYREGTDKTKIYKEGYLRDLKELIKQRQKSAEKVREEYIRDVFKNQEKYRNDLKNMLGWPLAGYENTNVAECSADKLSEEEGYCIYRMQFDILPGVRMSGLFFKADGDDKKPLVIIQHGGQGTPEEVCGVYGGTGTYNDMLHRVRKYGVHAFAPQLLLWSDRYEVKYDRKAIDAELKRVGSSITAVEIYGIMRIIDYFDAQKYVSAFGMVGLSYGGFYTLYTAALDVRIKSAVSCSFFNKRDVVGWSDWTWQNSAYMFDDAEIACLVYPRRLCIELGREDELFDYIYGEKSFEKLRKMCGEKRTQWAQLLLFDGKHEFCPDDVPIEQLIKDLAEASD